MRVSRWNGAALRSTRRRSDKLTATAPRRSRSACRRADARLLQARLLAGSRCGRPSARARTPARRRAPASAESRCRPGPGARSRGRDRRGFATRSAPTATTRSPACTPARSAGPPLARPLTTRRPSRSAVYMPSHGRGGSAERPVRTRSSRIGSSRSTGTNMLPSTVSSPAFSCTSSEPMPMSRPSSSSSAAPLHSGCGGVVNSAVVEQVFPVAGELALGEHRRLQRVRAPAVADDVDVVVLRHRRGGTALERPARRGGRAAARGRSPSRNRRRADGPRRPSRRCA